MPTIPVENLNKIFHITQTAPGVRGAVKALFTLHLEAKVALFVIIYRMWVFGRRHYSGTGS